MLLCARILVGLAVLVLAAPLRAGAGEYRLRVTSLYEDAFYALLGAAGTRREGPVEGASRLIETLDSGKAPAGVILYDRPIEAAGERVAKAFGALRARPKAPQDGDENLQWSEVRWDGKPGEPSVWVIAASRPRWTEVRDVALKGTGPLVRVIPHRKALSQPPAMAVGVPLGFLQGHEGDPALWTGHLSTALDLGEGLAVIVGENGSSGFADHVYIVVRNGFAPTTYYVVLAWKERPHEIQAGGGDRNMGIFP